MSETRGLIHLLSGSHMLFYECVAIWAKQTELLPGLFTLHINKQTKENTRLTKKGQHEDPVVTHSELIGVTEVVSGREVIILTQTHTDVQMLYYFKSHNVFWN